MWCNHLLNRAINVTHIDDVNELSEFPVTDMLE